MAQFTWVPIYEELGQALLGYEQRQGEVLEFLRGAKSDGLLTVGLDDKNAAGQSMPLAEIDPFTVYANFNRELTKTNRLAILDRFREWLSLSSPLPDTFDGLPTVQNQSAWYFSYDPKRRPTDIPTLWEIARAAITDGAEGISEDLFQRALAVRKTGKANLTMGLFWMRPDRFLPYDANTRSYLKHLGVSREVKRYQDYLDVLGDVRRKTEDPFPKVSWDAWGHRAKIDPVPVVVPGSSRTPAYLLLWNPERWDWTSDEIDRDIEHLRSGGAVGGRWSTGVTKAIASGDKVYLMRVGDPPKGIFASGRAVTPVFQGEHWDESKAAQGKTVNRIEMDFDEFINPRSTPLLSHARLEELFPDHHWSPMASGTSIGSDVAGELELAWQRHLLEQDAGPLRLSETAEDVRRNVRTFAAYLANGPEEALVGLRQAAYWVHDPDSGGIAPAKWGALRGMSPETYVAAQRLQAEFGSFRGFNGGRTQKHLGALLDQDYAPDTALAATLHARMSQAYGAESAEGLDPDRLRFVRLPDVHRWEIANVNEAHVRDILRVLCRIPVPRGQLVLHHHVMAAAGEAFSFADVRAALGFDSREGSGLLGALARRINGSPRETPRDEGPGLDLMLTRVGGEEGTESFRARPELGAAIRRLPELEEYLNSNLSALVHGEERSYTLPEGVTPDPSAVRKPPTEPFAHLLDTLASEGLHYPSELVANLLLALQTKRFVILTGISGTGKTRIAQALAKQFEIRRQVEVVEETDDEQCTLTVRPYMHKHRRITLPVALIAQIPSLSDTETTSIRTLWPGGETELTVNRSHPSALMLYLRADARSWLMDNCPVGSSLILEAVGPDGEPPDSLRIEPAARTSSEERVIDNYAMLAVRPDWTDSRGLLGYYNPITQRYVPTKFLQLLLRAQEEHDLAKREDRPADPFFVVLDEMNLARVEHYFSDFLSALESGEPIHLHDVDELEGGESVAPEQDGPPIPKQLVPPDNVYFMGTVNVDESTYMFSPKVLDRAFTLELNDVDLEHFGEHSERGGELDLVRWDGRLTPKATRRPTTDDWIRFGTLDKGELKRHVLHVHDLLSRRNRHFGYRVANEIARFVGLASDQTRHAAKGAWQALDVAILQKVLVKMHGTQQELQQVLDELVGWALVGLDTDSTLHDPGQWAWNWSDKTLTPKDAEAAATRPMFPRSAAKLWRMRDRLRDRGFTSWVE